MKKLFLTILFVAILAGVGYLILREERPIAAIPEAHPERITKAEAIESMVFTERFIEEDEKRFSFKYPENFLMTTIKEASSTAYIVANAKAGIGAQVIESDWQDGEYVFTRKKLLKQAPSMFILDERQVLAGPNIKALSFVSDNPAFDGYSAEIWFVSGGRLYQLSTYGEYRKFLEKLFATWNDNSGMMP